MTLRREFARARPDFPLLAAGDVDGLHRFLSARGWLAPGETVKRCDRAGEGNMNLTLRVETDRRSFVLKQSRPWVEKYDDIAAPLERAHFERAFYERVASLPGVADRMPALLHADSDACVLILEDVGGGRGAPASADLTSIYAGGRLDAVEIDELADYLRALHDGTRLGRGAIDAAALQNRDMRALNADHLFVVPLAGDGGPSLDARAPGLAEAADELRRDADYREAVRDTASRYLAGEADLDAASCLVHGDYFPGSWLRTDRGVRVIDPEFAFPGDAEVDIGCASAHLALAARPRAELARLLVDYADGGARPLDPSRLARYAAVEVMRRLIGVAQLPLAPDADGFRPALLRRSRRAMLEGDVELLFE